MNEVAVRKWMEETLNGRFHDNLSEWARAAGGMSTSTLHGLMTRGRTDPDTLVKIGKAAGATEEYMFVLAGWLPQDRALSPEATEAARLVEEADPQDRRILLVPLRAAALELKRVPPEPVYRPGRPSSLRIADRPGE